MSKSKDSPMTAEVRHYIQKENRPFSAIDVFNNLNTKDNKVSKTAIVKALEELAEKEIIKEKVNGKQKIYFADQSVFEEVDDIKLKQLDVSIKELTDRSNQLESDIRGKESRLSTLKNSLTADQLEQRMTHLTEEVKVLNNRLKAIDNKTQDFDPEVNQTVKKERQTLVTEWRKRKRMASNMIDQILEGYPKSKKIFFEENGIETDEQFNAVLPQI